MFHRTKKKLFNESVFRYCVFFFNDTAPTEIYTLSLHDALPIYRRHAWRELAGITDDNRVASQFLARSEEHTAELQSRLQLGCRLLLEKKKQKKREMVRLMFARHSDGEDQDNGDI